MKKRQTNYYIEAEVKVPCYCSEVSTTAVKANSKEEALELFNGELKSRGCLVNSLSKKSSEIPGIVFFLIVLVMSGFSYFEKDGFNSISLYPNVISIIFSIVFYSSFVIKVKGIDRIFKTIPDIIISLLFILVFAIFIKIFAGDGKVATGVVGKILTRTGFNSSYYLIFAALALSWLGIKQLCGFIWIAIIGLGLAQFITLGNYLDNIKGSVFILSAFCGFVFYFKYEGKVIFSSFRKNYESAFVYVKGDVEKSAAFTQSAIARGAQKIKSEKMTKNFSAVAQEGSQISAIPSDAISAKAIQSDMSATSSILSEAAQTKQVQGEAVKTQAKSLR